MGALEDAHAQIEALLADEVVGIDVDVIECLAALNAYDRERGALPTSDLRSDLLWVRSALGGFRRRLELADDAVLAIIGVFSAYFNAGATLFPFGVAAGGKSVTAQFAHVPATFYNPAVANVVSTTVWYVDGDAADGGDGSSATPFNTIGAALSAASAGDEIRVRDAATAYAWTITATFASRVTVRPDTGHNPTFSQFTVDGSAFLTFTGFTVAASLIVTNSDDIVVQNCTLNGATGTDGAFSVVAGSQRVTCEDCTIDSPTAGVHLAGASSFVTVRRTTISSEADGVRWQDANDTTVEDVTFSAMGTTNTFGQHACLRLLWAQRAVIRRCKMSGFTTKAMLARAPLNDFPNAVIDDLLVENLLAYGGGTGLVVRSYSNTSGVPTGVKIVNSTVWDKPDADTGSILYEGNITLTVFNCIAEGGVVEVDPAGGGGTLHATANTSTDPGFANPASGDFHLTVSHDGVASHNNVTAPAADLDGVARLSPPDRGCYEYTTVAVVSVAYFDASPAFYAPKVSGPLVVPYLDAVAAFYQPAVSSGISRLGLHVSAVELGEWRSRAANGPYKSAGDVQKNSPPDWADIVSRKDAFVANPGFYKWPGPVSGYPNAIDTQNSKTYDLPGSKSEADSAESIRDAAFYAMVLGSTQITNPAASITTSARDSILTDVKTILLEQVRSKYLDFSDTTRYDTSNFGGNWQFHYRTAKWITKTVHAYDYSQVANPNLWTSAEKKEFVQWIVNAARYWGAFVDHKRNGMFESDGVTPTTKAEGDIGLPIIWHGGPKAVRSSQRLDNHYPIVVWVPFLAGMLDRLENTRSGVSVLSASQRDSWIDYGRRGIRDYLIIEFIAGKGGTGGGSRAAGGNFYRWGDPPPINGWRYAMRYLGRVMYMVDSLARIGDMTGYTYETTKGTSLSSGQVAATDAGAAGPKTMFRAVGELWSYIDENSTPARYGHDTNSTQNYRIDSRDDLNNKDEVMEWESLMGLSYWNNDYLKSVYRRTRAGTPALSTNYTDGGDFTSGGPAGVYPGANIMFARMEAKGAPYP